MKVLESMSPALRLVEEWVKLVEKETEGLDRMLDTAINKALFFNRETINELQLKKPDFSELYSEASEEEGELSMNKRVRREQVLKAVAEVNEEMVHEKTLVENSPLTGLDLENRNLLNRLAVLDHQLQFKSDRHMVQITQLQSENEALKVKRLFRSLGHNIRNHRSMHQAKKPD